MKSRLDFITNSSSASYVIAIPADNKELKAIMNKRQAKKLVPPENTELYVWSTWEWDIDKFLQEHPEATALVKSPGD